MCCGQMSTLAITVDGSQVFACGDADNCAFGTREFTGNHYRPIVSHLWLWPANIIIVCVSASAPSDSHGPICEGLVRQQVLCPPHH